MRAPAIGVGARCPLAPTRRSARMKDNKEAPREGGSSSLAQRDASAETSERDLKPGQRRKGGQDVEAE